MLYIRLKLKSVKLCFFEVECLASRKYPIPGTTSYDLLVLALEFCI